MRQITPYEYIKIDIANHFGLDKKLWQERIDWTTKNDSKLESLESGADSPLLYNKAVRSLRMVQKGEPTNIPVSLDSTWSGGQLMSVLMRCKKTAKASNMIDTGKRLDIYTVVQNYMNTTFNLSITRQEMKDVLMPRYYSSTKTAKDTFGKNSNELRAFIATCEDRLPGAELCLDVMNTTWNDEALTHNWIRDDGTHVVCPVMEKEKKRISIGDTSFTQIADVNTCKEDGLSNAANFIQSLDGLVMARMVKMASDQGYELYGVHDSFWCHPLHMQKTRENYLSIMIDLAKKPIMVDWMKQMTGEDYKELSNKKIQKFVALLETADYF